jgi:hypothetical protein
MDWLAVKEKAGYFLRKYRYVLLILLVGIVLMCLPGGEEPEQERVSRSKPTGCLPHRTRRSGCGRFSAKLKVRER